MKRKDPNNMRKTDMLALVERAGILPHEMRHDPKHGLLLSPSGVRKLAALAPDNKAKLDLLASVANVEAQTGRR